MTSQTISNSGKNTLVAKALAASVFLFSSVSISAAGWFSSSSTAADALEISTEQVKKVLKEHPELVYDALVDYQKKQAETKKQDIQKYLHANSRKLFYDKNDGVLGNPSGKTSILVLNDYRCGFCTKARAIIDEVAKKNSDLRVVIKQLPILGPESKYAAKAATLAQQKNRFESFNAKLSHQDKPLTIEKVNAVIKQSGIKEADMKTNDDALDAVIRENYVHAQNLAVQGTPVVIIANSNLTKVEFIENVLDQKAIEAKVKEYQS